MYNIQTIKNIPAYVICLDRKREERCDKTMPKIKEIFPKTTWVNAVDGSKLEYLNDNRISVFAKYNVKNNYKIDHSFMNNVNQLACALSHIKAWKKIKDSGVPGIIFEDDVTIDKTLKDRITNIITKIPKHVDFASILYTGNDNTEKFSDNWFKIINNSFVGLLTYFITPKGASILLQNAFPIEVHIDRYVGYISSINPEFKAICYKDKYYPPLETYMKSTLNHPISFKSELPDNNTFYWIGIAITLVIIIGVIFIIVFLNKDRQKCNIQLKKYKKK
jgi:GR25 family glycosyltransferase involved in LPS biosynthesis